MENGKMIYYPIYHPIGEPGSERSDYVREWVERFMKPAGEVTDNIDEANAILAAVGDGGLMRYAHTFREKRLPIFGINCGRKGFLLNTVSNISEIPKRFEDVSWINLRLLKCTFNFKDETKAPLTLMAFNDIVIGKDIADFVDEFIITGSLKHFPNRSGINGTGMIVSTAQGTSAYAIKVKGSSVLLPLDSNTWLVCGFGTGPYPCDQVEPQKITIEIKSRHIINGYADGKSQAIAEDINSAIIEPTDYEVILGYLKGVDFRAVRTSKAQEVERGK